MAYQVRGPDGDLLDAHYDIDGDSIIFHSRGGSSGRGGQNSQYGPGLRALLERLHRAGLRITGGWVDSAAVRSLRPGERQILRSDDASPKELFTELSREMRRIGQGPDVKSGGNSTRRIRLTVSGASAEELASVLEGQPIAQDTRHSDRLLSEQLRGVRPAHVYRAVQRFRESPEEFADLESSTYDLVDEDGTLLPPKAVFGLAASEALGFTVQPRDFVGGEGTVCFAILRESGYRIVPKGSERTLGRIDSRSPEAPPATPEDREWAEGQPRRLTHLRRERSAAAAKAKREELRKEVGRLVCEKCGLDPVEEYGGSDGEACLEVHHLLPLADSEGQRRVSVDDLQLLCANCHRVEHRRLRDGADE